MPLSERIPASVKMRARNLHALTLGDGIRPRFATPFDVIDSAPHRELRRYGTPEQIAAVREAGGIPVLLVPPLAVSASCFDLGPGQSLVQHLLDIGRIPYLVDYGDITKADRDLGFQHFVTDIIPAAIELTVNDFGSDDPRVDLAAWSLGGTMSLMTAAYGPSLPIRSVVSVASPLNYMEIPGYPLLRKIAKPIDGQPITWLTRVSGGVPAPLVQAAYRATSWDRELRKPKYILQNLTDTDALARMETVDRFQRDMPGYPGLVSEQMWKNFLLKDELSSGVLTFTDHEGVQTVIDLTSLALPVLLFGSHRDAIAPHAAVEHGTTMLASADVTFSTVEASHLGLIAGAPASSETWPQMERFWAELS